MTLAMSRCLVAITATIIFSTVTKSYPRAFAFAPVTQTSNRHTGRVKGREIFALQSSIATPDSKQSDAKATKVKRSKQKPTKGRKKIVTAQDVAKKNVNKGKGPSATRSFKPLKDLKLGSKVSGTVVDVCDFGAFVNIGYATHGSRAGTALLHISQIQDKKIENILDVVKVGDTLDGARVISIDLKKGEVGLSLRASRPKRRDFTKLKFGDELEGKVDTVVSYGVFVDVGTNVNALLHISRINGGAIENVRHHLNEGDPVSVHVIDIDREKKTMAVSMLDKKADQYLDRRMSQRLKRFYGTTAAGRKLEDEEDEPSDIDYFDQAIRELEEALRGREE